MVHPVDAYFSLAHESMILKIFDAKTYGLKESNAELTGGLCRSVE